MLLKFNCYLNFLLFIGTMVLAIFGDSGRVTGRIVAAFVFLFFYVLLAVASKAADQVLADRRAETAKKEEAS